MRTPELAVNKLIEYGVIDKTFLLTPVTKKSFSEKAREIFHLSTVPVLTEEAPLTLDEAVFHLAYVLRHASPSLYNRIQPQLLTGISAQLSQVVTPPLAALLLYNAIRTTSMFNPATDWLSKSRYGIMQHFLLFDDTYQEKINAFDVKKYAAMIHEAGAEHLIFTLGQCTGYYCSPNRTYDRIAGHAPGEHTSLRDLPMEIAEALQPYGIRLMLYIPITPSSVSCDPKFNRGIGWNPYFLDAGSEQITMWNEVLREWSLRYGDAVSGWWVDGNYDPSNYNDYSQSGNFITMGEALRAGNPDAIVAYNPGIAIVANSYYEDYTAGESNDFNKEINGRWFKGEQWHELCFIGRNWGGGWGGNGFTGKEEETRYSNRYMIDYIRNINEKGGALTIDVPMEPYFYSDTIHPLFMEQLRNISAGLDGKPYADCFGQDRFPEVDGTRMPNAFFNYIDSGIDQNATESSGVIESDEAQTGNRVYRVKTVDGATISSFNKLIDITRGEYEMSVTVKCMEGEVEIMPHLSYWVLGEHNYDITGKFAYENGNANSYTKVGTEWVTLTRRVTVNDSTEPFCTRFTVCIRQDGKSHDILVDNWNIKKI